jgi:mannose-6-phosphate isomerase-like protein (cupin superfamily)
MKESVHRTHGDGEYFFEEGCYILEMWNAPEDDAASIARARVRPGDATKWHRLKNIVERYVVMEGIGRIEIGDLPTREVGIGDVVVIPSNTRQRITNTGDNDLIFLCICTPRFIKAYYESLE